jgi:hypothetical protein
MALFSYHGGIPAPLPEGLIGAETDRLKALGYSKGHSRLHHSTLARKLQNGLGRSGPSLTCLPRKFNKQNICAYWGVQIGLASLKG